MPEILLHYIWQHRLWAGFAQQTTDGREVEIISVGQHNRDAGPDFTNVHLRIGEQDWFGNVELHIHASDWYKHRHQTDTAYDNIILHVVCDADKKVYNSHGDAVAQCELRYPQNVDYLSQILQPATQMDSAFGSIECSRQLLSDPTLLSEGWRKALLNKRMECKHQSIRQLLTITQQSWVHAFYITLAHNFGFHTNGIPFETLALQTPLSCLLKHRNSLFQITAILLGQSGLLTTETATDAESLALLSEYQFLGKKFSLTPMDAHLWKRARLRPQNFPEVRIRQFAQLLYQSEFLFADLVEETDISRLHTLLELRTPPAEASARIAPATPLGSKSIDILLINTVIPYKYAYALAREDTHGAEQALLLLQHIAPEDNTIIRQWKLLGQSIRNAADTQALIHLFQNYCQPHRCIHCEIGHLVFERPHIAMQP